MQCRWCCSTESRQGLGDRGEDAYLGGRGFTHQSWSSTGQKGSTNRSMPRMNLHEEPSPDTEQQHRITLRMRSAASLLLWQLRASCWSAVAFDLRDRRRVLCGRSSFKCSCWYVWGFSRLNSYSSADGGYIVLIIYRTTKQLHWDGRSTVGAHSDCSLVDQCKARMQWYLGSL